MRHLSSSAQKQTRFPFPNVYAADDLYSRSDRPRGAATVPCGYARTRYAAHSMRIVVCTTGGVYRLSTPPTRETVCTNERTHPTTLSSNFRVPRVESRPCPPGQQDRSVLQNSNMTMCTRARSQASQYTLSDIRLKQRLGSARHQSQDSLPFKRPRGRGRCARGSW